MTDPFSEAREAFVKMDDVEGRLLLITVLDSGERESTLKGAKAGDMYTYIVTDTVVLDGELTEMIDEIPMELEGFQFSGQAITGQLLPHLKKVVNGTGNGMVLNRLGTKPNSWKTKTWILQEVTEEDKAIARKYLASVAARKAAAKPEDPFAAAAAAE
jgi:hypothetical protein